MEYEVEIIETLRKTVVIDAKNRDEARRKVERGWKNGDYILDADNFSTVEFKTDIVKTELSYVEMVELFRRVNDSKRHPVDGYIVFEASNFDTPYDEISRTYRVSSDNKAFQAGMNASSIFASCLDGTDQNIRLDAYLKGWDAWKIERCYMAADDYNRITVQRKEKTNEN